MAAKKQDVVVEDGAVYVLRAGTPVYVKTADICSMTGKSNQWIGQLVAQGTLHKRSTPHGSLFDITEAVRAYCSMLEARAGPAKTEEEIKQEIKQEKAKAAADVTIAKAEADELQGKMHRSEDVAAMTTDLIYAIRGAMMALPGRLAVNVASANSPAEAAEIIRREVNKAMRELSNYRYDPKKYEERVRERRAWEADSGRDADDG